MGRQEAYEQYSKALKLAQKSYKDSVLHGRYPYPPVLDEILMDDSILAGQADLGIIEIPTELIIGTKTAGRRSAFASNFMPLLDMDSEFAYKWIDLCAAHLSDEGIRDPIRCYEYLGRFYVQEGNKRVSVLKSYDSPTIPGYVIRMIPRWSEDPAVQVYYEFMASYQLSGLYQAGFTRPGSFARLQAAMGYEPDYVWNSEDRQRFISGLTYFRAAYKKLGGNELPLTPADALLVWLRVYPFDSLKTSSSQELLKSITAIWPDIKVLASPEPISVSTAPAPDKEEPDEKPEPNLLGRIFKAMFPSHLNVAFINERSPEESDWARAHDLGRKYLEAVLEDRVDVQVFDGVRPGEEADAAMERAAANGAQVIFATTPPLITACRKAAAKHPGIRILNCSAAMPYTGVRTYYSRIYEGKFITGAIAGAMSPDGRIGYVASNPIFGVPASINAFALGAWLVNPRAHIRLKWSCVDMDPMGDLIREGVTVLSNRDLPTPDRVQEPWGLCQLRPDGSLMPLASPYWHWGNFYVKIIRSIFNGGWEALSSKGDKAVNYWWGMNSRVVDVLLSENLPEGVRQLVKILQLGVTNGSIEPFRRRIRSQDGKVRSEGERWFSPEEILHMDWLCDCVEGGIPEFPELLPMSRTIVRLQGVYRDQIPPEKEGPSAVKLLLLSDKESPYLWDYYQPGRLDEYDLMISCGDLNANYLSFLVTMGRAPLLYVHGNHDAAYEQRPSEGCDCIEDRLVKVNGLRILGLGGSAEYSGGPHQYTERQMARRIRRLWFQLYRAKGVDIIVTHSPASGYGDAEDYAHRGFECLLPLLDKYQPKYLIHGHVHANYNANRPRVLQRGNTTIINAYERYVLDLPE